MAAETFARPEHDRQVLAAWERLMHGAEPALEPVRPLIAQSWLRCRHGEVDPSLRGARGILEPRQLAAHRDRHRTLLDASTPVMSAAREFLSDAGSIMLLTDARGLILGVEGDPATLERATDIQLVPGLGWDELATGTNAIGTALAIGRAVQVHGAEHYCEGIKTWTCSAAVVHDPCDGRILGAVDVSGLSGAYSRQSLAFVVSAAAQIEAHLRQLGLTQRYRILERCGSPLSTAHADGVVLFDPRGFAIKANSQAAVALDASGVPLGADRALRVEALDVEAPEPRARLPDWLSAARLEPLMDGTERIGTLAALAPRRGSPARRPRPEPARTAAEGDPFAPVVGASGALREAVERARLLARARTPVLLLGETGVGKELFARGIHASRFPAGAPLVAVNCAGLSRDLLASELFGYAEGAFTGARRGGMPGKIEAAEGGTLFLDEIAEMPLELQGHLLRALESGEVYRLGENSPRRIDFRLISATNREPRAEVAAARFRMDLFYRVAVTSVRVPPLRDRPEDVVPLAEHFLRLLSPERPRFFTAEALSALRAHRWPGNVRELRNVVESIALTSTGDLLSWEELPPELRDEAARDAPEGPPAHAHPEDGSALQVAELDAIRAAMRRERGNLTRAARHLGIAKSTLYAKIEVYGLAADIALARRGSS
jgi:sigma-54 dependent transcriptional regulator, acetoin dehydrogenase operon transcriptional activator AcoR